MTKGPARHGTLTDIVSSVVPTKLLNNSNYIETEKANTDIDLYAVNYQHLLKRVSRKRHLVMKTGAVAWYIWIGTR